MVGTLPTICTVNEGELDTLSDETVLSTRIDVLGQLTVARRERRETASGESAFPVHAGRDAGGQGVAPHRARWR